MLVANAVVRRQIKCYKQLCIALAIKKVRFCRGAKGVEQKISTKMAKISKEFKDMNAEAADLGLSGLQTCQE